MPAPPYRAAKQHIRTHGARAWAAWLGSCDRQGARTKAGRKGQARAAMRSVAARGAAAADRKGRRESQPRTHGVEGYRIRPRNGTGRVDKAREIAGMGMGAHDGKQGRKREPEPAPRSAPRIR